MNQISNESNPNSSHLSATVILLRHGPAEDRLEFRRRTKEPDAQRPLTKKGKLVVKLTGQTLREIFDSVDSIYSSPFVRTNQTAIILQKILKVSKLKYLDELKPNFKVQNTKTILQMIEPGKKYIFVGHEPDLSRILSFILTERDESFSVFKKGGFAVVQMSFKKRGKLSFQIKEAQLTCLISPFIMKKIKKM